MSMVKALLESRITVNVPVPVVKLIRFEYSAEPRLDAHGDQA
jgi:hypothetical protein